MTTQELLTQLDEQMIIKQNIENQPAYQEWKAQDKKCEEIKDQIKEKIRAGEEIAGSEKYEIKKSYTTVYDGVQLGELIDPELADSYRGNPLIKVEYPKFDKKKFEDDLKNGILPEIVANIKTPGNFKILFQERKQTEFEM